MWPSDLAGQPCPGRRSQVFIQCDHGITSDVRHRERHAISFKAEHMNWILRNFIEQKRLQRKE